MLFKLIPIKRHHETVHLGHIIIQVTMSEVNVYYPAYLISHLMFVPKTLFWDSGYLFSLQRQEPYLFRASELPAGSSTSFFHASELYSLFRINNYLSSNLSNGTIYPTTLLIRLAVGLLQPNNLAMPSMP